MFTILPRTPTWVGSTNTHTVCVLRQIGIYMGESIHKCKQTNRTRQKATACHGKEKERRGGANLPAPVAEVERCVASTNHELLGRTVKHEASSRYCDKNRKHAESSNASMPNARLGLSTKVASKGGLSMRANVNEGKGEHLHARPRTLAARQSRAQKLQVGIR